VTSAPEELKDWLTLAAVPGIGALTLRRLLGGLGLPGAVLAAPRGELLKHLTERQCAALKECQADEAVQERVAVALEWAQAPGNRLMTLADAD
jgi:DNA processing protein